jgi:WD40 repeat protein
VRCLRTIKGHSGVVSSVSWHPDENEYKLVSGSWDKTIKIWDAGAGEHAYLLCIIMCAVDVVFNSIYRECDVLFFISCLCQVQCNMND